MDGTGWLPVSNCSMLQRESVQAKLRGGATALSINTLKLTGGAKMQESTPQSVIDQGMRRVS